MPLAMVVANFACRMPLAGGMYRRAEVAFGRSFGYFVALNLWVSTVINLAKIGVECAGSTG